MIDLSSLERIDLPKRTINLDEYVRRHAEDKDCSIYIDRPVAIYEGAELKIVYAPTGHDETRLVNALNTIQFGHARRTGGMMGKSRTFGFMPRRVIRQDYCNLSKLAQQQPDVHALIVEEAGRLAEVYEQVNPAIAARHKSLMGQVMTEYAMNPVFTSGIINRDNALLYHFDSGNFEDVWSSMLVFKRDIEGGRLCVPEYDLLFELRNNTLFMFDGQSLLHGVTHIKRKTPQAFRYSMVFYSLRQMWNCDPLDSELARIRQLKTAREQKRANDTRAALEKDNTDANQ